MEINYDRVKSEEVVPLSAYIVQVVMHVPF